MARANKGGWDFVKVGGNYQYKEDGWIAEVTILEDNSTDEEYRFKMQTNKASGTPPTPYGIFEISHTKNLDGYFSGMVQLYETPEYMFTTKWTKPETEEDIKVYELDFGDTNLIDKNPQVLIDWISTEIKDMKCGDELNYIITSKMMSVKEYEALPEWA